MSLESAIARFRQRQADLFRDEATATRPGTGEGTIDPVTGVYTPPAATAVYDGPCLFRGQRWEATEVQAGDEQVLLPHLQAKFPVGSGIQRDDVVVATASTYDPDMVGKSYVVRDPHNDGWKIVDWFIIEEVVG